MSNHKCPPECDVRLAHIEDHQRDHTHEGLWEELRMKVTLKMFFWMVGIAVVVLLAVFGAIYRQGGITLEKVQAAQVEQAKIQSSLESHSQNTELVRELITELRKENGDNQ